MQVSGLITISGRFARYAEIWFDETPSPEARADVLMFRLRTEPVTGASCTPFHTLVSDLTLQPDALIAQFGGTNRYKVKRSDARDDLTCEFMMEPDAELDAFCDFYDGFAAQKKLPASYRRGLFATATARQLVVSVAAHAGARIVWHAYVRYAHTAALLHSASHFRGDGIDRALVGRANRWLHWRDMLAFKAAGVTQYDWGGLFDDESIAAQKSVNEFKREFGGAEAERYNCVLPRTLKGRAYIALRRLLDR